MIKENIELIKKDLNDNVTLIAVSKTKPVKDMLEAYECGIKDFGENYTNEIVEKYPLLPKDINLHMIGHLQTNKVKSIIDKVNYIHSVDSLKLANIINKECIKINKIMNIFIEINIGKEESKTGIKEEDLLELINNLKESNNIKIIGLMCIAPNSNNNTIYFKRMNELLKEANNINKDIKYLSMGMSNDYKDAIKYNTNYIRVGTKIFGERDYKK